MNTSVVAIRHDGKWSKVIQLVGIRGAKPMLCRVSSNIEANFVNMKGCVNIGFL